MSRLLFAAARGARIQTNDRGGWVDAAYIPTADYKGDDFRIHPDDEHLQYGHISTDMLNASENVYEYSWLCQEYLYIMNSFLTAGALAEYSSIDERKAGWNSALNLTRSLFLLILAEVLADEGM
jgi:hypothetical protein